MTRDQRGGIITGFLFRAVVMFAILGLLVFEAGAIIVANVAVDGIAQDAAREAALTYDQTAGSKRKAKKECERLAARAGAVCEKIEVADGFVTARVRKEARTVFAHRIGALRDFATPTAQHSAPIP